MEAKEGDTNDAVDEVIEMTILGQKMVKARRTATNTDGFRNIELIYIECIKRKNLKLRRMRAKERHMRQKIGATKYPFRIYPQDMEEVGCF